MRSARFPRSATRRGEAPSSHGAPVEHQRGDIHRLHDSPISGGEGNQRYPFHRLRKIIESHCKNGISGIRERIRRCPTIKTDRQDHAEIMCPRPPPMFSLMSKTPVKTHYSRLSKLRYEENHVRFLRKNPSGISRTSAPSGSKPQIQSGRVPPHGFIFRALRIQGSNPIATKSNPR